ncbi:MAG TPA: C39 family peptidase, partial [Blastocatellia bacterium]|nr:C39 family peptidase [Blastocatellia bacterium]
FCLCGVMPAAEDSGVWLDVPFVKQEKDGCGAASIAMVMQYWFKRQDRLGSESVDAAEIHRDLYAPGSRGVYASAMVRYFKQRGFTTFAFRGDWEDMLNHLRKGRPLIVALKPSEVGAPLHYVVVAGLDPGAGLVMLNDPARRKLLKQDRADFEKQWSGVNKWTLLALPQSDAK